MASINIADLQPAGSDLFNDSESFMNELTNEELGTTKGGITPALVVSGVFLGSWAWRVTRRWGWH